MYEEKKCNIMQYVNGLDFKGKNASVLIKFVRKFSHINYPLSATINEKSFYNLFIKLKIKKITIAFIR